MTSPSTSPGQTGASPGSVSAALGNGHAGGAGIVQSLVRTHGGFTIDGDGIGDESGVASADATTEPDSQSESGGLGDPDGGGQSSDGSVVTLRQPGNVNVGGASRSSRQRRGQSKNSRGESDLLTVLAKQTPVMEQMAKVIQSQQEDRKSATPSGGGDVGRQNVGVNTVRMLAHPAVKALRLCNKELTSSERHQLELTVKNWMSKAQVVNNKSVESFEAEVAAMLSRYGAVKGGVLYTRIVRFCLAYQSQPPEPILLLSIRSARSCVKRWTVSTCHRTRG